MSLAGATLSHYTILEKLGEGGMGVVYKARDTVLNRTIALKTLRAGQRTPEERRRRFLQEARTASALNHPNIVGVYEIDSADGVDFIAMEWVDGLSMDRLIPPQGLPPRQVLKYALQVADALNRAHAAGIIHRDLKPANLLVAADGTVKVADFGLAKLTAESGSDPHAPTATFKQEPALTEEGAVLGTVSYMSPEQAEGKPLDARSDIFSFGAVLYEMITGRRAFAGETRVSTLAAILTRDPEPLSEILPGLPQELDRLVTRCLRKEPERRIQHMGDVRLAIQELIEETESGRSASLPRAAARRRRRWKWAAAWSASLAAAVVGAVLVTMHVRRPAAWRGNVVFEQLTSEPGQEFFPSLSPDGNSFVYAGSRSGRLHIYLRRPGGLNAIDLTPGGSEDTQPAFSPDGQSIVFRSSRDGGGLFLMGATGESVRRLTGFGFNPSWSPDGARIACTDYQMVSGEHRSNVASRLWVVERETGRGTALDVPDALQPTWSPHGFRIAYCGAGGSGNSDIWTVNANPAAPPGRLPVTADAAYDWNPVWSPDGEWLYFASDRGGAMGPWRVRIEESSGRVLGAPEPVPVPSAYAGHLTFSRDGSRMAFASMRSEAAIETIGFDPQAERLTGEPEPLAERAHGMNPHISSDGRALAYASKGQRVEAIVTAGPQGEKPRQITEGGPKNRAPQWSPDGASLVFYSNRSGRFEVWQVRADGSGLRRLTDSGRGSAWFPAWSPDGRRVSYYAVGAGSFLLEMPPAGKPGRGLPIGRPDPNLIAWDWSPDGRFLAMQRKTDTELFGGFGVYELATGRFRLLAESGGAPTWLRDGRSLLYWQRGRWMLMDAADSRARDLGPAPRIEERLSLSADNRRLYFATMNLESDIWMARQR